MVAGPRSGGSSCGSSGCTCWRPPIMACNNSSSAYSNGDNAGPFRRILMDHIRLLLSFEQYNTFSPLDVTRPNLASCILWICGDLRYCNNLFYTVMLLKRPRLDEILLPTCLVWFEILNRVTRYSCEPAATSPYPVFHLSNIDRCPRVK